MEIQHIKEKSGLEKGILSQTKDYEKESALIGSELRGLLRTLLPKIPDLSKEDKREFLKMIQDKSTTSVDLMSVVTNLVTEKFI